MRLFTRVSIRRSRSAHGFGLCSSHCVSASSPTAEAQTTVVLNVPGSQVIDTTIRNGPYAATQSGRRRAADEVEHGAGVGAPDPPGFNTGTIPDRTVITSATLTLTLKSGLGTQGATRPVTSFASRQRSTKRRRPGTAVRPASPGRPPEAISASRCRPQR